MDRATRAAAAFFAAAAVRHLLVLRGIFRSRRFLQAGTATAGVTAAPGTGPGDSRVSDAAAPVLRVVVPVLREAAILDDTLDHFTRLTRGTGAPPIIVTTAREHAEQHLHPTDDTVQKVRQAAAAGRCTHLH